MNVIFGLEHLSALSVEIMTTSLFGGAVFTYVAMSHFGILPKLQKLVLAGAMGLGVLLLAIANVYTLATLDFITLSLVLVGYPLYLFWLGQVDLPANPLGLFDYHGSQMLARLGLLFAGLGIWVIAATRGNNSAVSLAAVSTVLVLTAELCGRIFFYDLHMFASGM